MLDLRKAAAAMVRAVLLSWPAGEALMGKRARANGIRNAAVRMQRRAQVDRARAHDAEAQQIAREVYRTVVEVREHAGDAPMWAIGPLTYVAEVAAPMVIRRHGLPEADVEDVAAYLLHMLSELLIGSVGVFDREHFESWRRSHPRLRESAGALGAGLSNLPEEDTGGAEAGRAGEVPGAEDGRARAREPGAGVQGAAQEGREGGEGVGAGVADEPADGAGDDGRVRSAAGGPEGGEGEGERDAAQGAGGGVEDDRRPV